MGTETSFSGFWPGLPTGVTMTWSCSYPWMAMTFPSNLLTTSGGSGVEPWSVPASRRPSGAHSNNQKTAAVSEARVQRAARRVRAYRKLRRSGSRSPAPRRQSIRSPSTHSRCSSRCRRRLARSRRTDLSVRTHGTAQHSGKAEAPRALTAQARLHTRAIYLYMQSPPSPAPQRIPGTPAPRCLIRAAKFRGRHAIHDHPRPQAPP
jgi:hypothetical protein